MILKGSQRSGAGQLAKHLLNDRDNDHVTLHEVKGFMARDLYGALTEARAVAKGTRCKQYMFSLSINPPQGAEAPLDAMLNAVDRAGKALGLGEQPRAIVVHEKKGRRHVHAVWSRIDIETMKAINLPHFKNRLAALSKELYLEHGWELPKGHRENGWKNPLNFTLAEWQQAKRLDLDPREIKQVFQSAWARSDDQGTFRHALEEHGFHLARGDRRGVVAIDLQGEVFSVSRWTGVSASALKARVSDLNKLPGVAEKKAELDRLLSSRMRTFLREDRAQQLEQLKPLQEQRVAMAAAHRQERVQLKTRQEERWKTEALARAAKLHGGVRGLWELLTGKARAIRRENEAEAYQGIKRDRQQTEDLHLAQLKDRRVLESRMDDIRRRHAVARQQMAGKLALVLRHARVHQNKNTQERSQDLGAELQHRKRREP